MSQYSVFIDGNSGTTGLMIEKLLSDRKDIALLRIDYEKRHDIEERVKLIEKADVSLICLADKHAAEIAEAAGTKGRLIDTSTYHRCNDNWVFGMPELEPDRRKLIAHSNRVANPGCHASGFILLMRPLVDAGIIKKDYTYSMVSLTGYSGGGKAMIEKYEAEGRDKLLDSPGIYAVGQSHKHIPEMMKMTGIEKAPFFSPIVSGYFSGMAVNIPLQPEALTDGSIKMQDIQAVYEKRYNGEPLIKIGELGYAGSIYGNELADNNGCLIRILGNEERKVLSISYDNLRKGASGSAIQNLNLMLGCSETTGLI